jgi:hypothetical protein
MNDMVSTFTYTSHDHCSFLECASTLTYLHLNTMYLMTAMYADTKIRIHRKRPCCRTECQRGMRHVIKLPKLHARSVGSEHPSSKSPHSTTSPTPHQTNIFSPNSPTIPRIPPPATLKTNIT